MHIDLESNVCLICLEECDTDMNFECCGNYKLHKSCYIKWIETNKNCLICRNQLIVDSEIVDSEIVVPEIVNPDFITYYITLARIKFIIYFYLTITLSFLNLSIFCIFKEDHCGLI
jgi:hypothetical protein